MQVGHNEINCTPNSTISFDSDTRLVCYGLYKSKRHAILGSGTKFKVQTGAFKKLEIWTTDQCFWTYSETKNYVGNPVDSTPMELAIEDKPPSLREEMRDYIREILSTQANMTGHETFEESFDFDIEDEFDPTSPYEMTDMVTEYEDLPITPPQSSLERSLDESDTNTAVEVNDAVSESTERPMD